MKLLLPTAYTGPAPQLRGVHIVDYDASQAIPAEHTDAEVLVAWGNAPNTLPAAARDMPNLRLVQALYAGPDDVLGAGFAEDVVLCSGVGLHDQPVAEHALALILSLIRQLPRSAQRQREHHWDEAIGGPQPLREHGGRTHSLVGARVLIWGFGSIAATLAPVLRALGAQVRGIARSRGTRADCEVYTEADIPMLFTDTDILVMILPQGQATTNALNSARLAELPASAYVVNVGRGSTLAEDALIAALQQGLLAGAAIDVAATEPLPSDSPLWDTPGLLITPHAAGGRPVGAAPLIEHNVNALLGEGSYRNLIAR